MEYNGSTIKKCKFLADEFFMSSSVCPLSSAVCLIILFLVYTDGMAAEQNTNTVYTIIYYKYILNTYICAAHIVTLYTLLCILRVAYIIHSYTIIVCVVAKCTVLHSCMSLRRDRTSPTAVRLKCFCKSRYVTTPVLLIANLCTRKQDERPFSATTMRRRINMFTWRA
jgi:hypothetical protein